MGDEPSDDDLFRAFQRGDRAAFESLARRWEPSMLGLAQGYLRGDLARALDAVQNAWVRIIRSAGGFRGESTGKAWAYRILLNECRRAAPSAAGTSRRAAAIGAGAVEPAVAGDALTSEPEDIQRIRAAVDALPADAREAILLCFHRNLTHVVAAEVLGLPLGTLKTRVRAALHELRAALSPEVAR